MHNTVNSALCMYLRKRAQKFRFFSSPLLLQGQVNCSLLLYIGGILVLCCHIWTVSGSALRKTQITKRPSLRRRSIYEKNTVYLMKNSKNRGGGWGQQTPRIKYVKYQQRLQNPSQTEILNMVCFRSFWACNPNKKGLNTVTKKMRLYTKLIFYVQWLTHTHTERQKST